MKTLHYNPVRAVKRKLLSIDSKPMKVCYGFAFGVFMATTPLIGFKWLLALPVVMLTKWSKAACLAGILQVNYLTGPVFYSLAFYTAKVVCGYRDIAQFPEKLNFTAFIDIFFRNTEVFISLLTGGLLLSIPATIGAFYLSKSLFNQKFKAQLS